MSGRIPTARNPRVLVWLAVSSFAVVGIGCGGKGATVSGTVSYLRSPVPSGTVTFFNDKSEVVGTSAISGGKYKIEKLPIGPVKISVSGVVTEEGPSRPIPRRYASPESSGLTYEVTSGSKEHPIDLN